MVEGSVNDDKVTTDKELCWVAAEDFDQFPMATPQKKMIKTYEDSKKDSVECYPFSYASTLLCFRLRKARYTFERTTPQKRYKTTPNKSHFLTSKLNHNTTLLFIKNSCHCS